MLVLLALAPLLTMLSSFLVLAYTGRNLTEKITIFFFNPKDTPGSSSETLFLFRFGFWISFFISVGIVIRILSESP